MVFKLSPHYKEAYFCVYNIINTFHLFIIIIDALFRSPSSFLKDNIMDLNTTQKDLFTIVPLEVLSNIFSYIPTLDRFSLLHVSKGCRSCICNSPAAWRTTETIAVNHETLFKMKDLQACEYPDLV